MYFADLTNNKNTEQSITHALTGTAKIGTAQIADPLVAPTVSATTSGCISFPAAGTYTYTFTYVDAAATAGGITDETKPSPASSGVTLDGSTQCALITSPAAQAGAVYYRVYRNGVRALPEQLNRAGAHRNKLIG